MAVKPKGEEELFAIAVRLRSELEESIGAVPSQNTREQLPSESIKHKLKHKLSLYLGGNNQGEPVASIVIPVYNKVEFTYQCLEQLALHESKYNFEVIVIDNASSDGTQEFIRSIPGIRYVRNPDNFGFVGACNQGALMAKGKYVVFLNNDAVVTGGWLDALIDRLQDENVGIAGSKLIYPDGRLQEAGGIIFDDATGNNYGKYGDAGDYRYNFAREADYCSGASLAIPRELFIELGMFGEMYAPAYYEDTDLAMKVRKKGLRVMYEPRSVAVHIEGGTAGTNTNTGFKRFQEINHKKFLKKWRSELKKNHLPSSTIPLKAAWSGKPRRLLIVDDMVPEYDRDSGLLRMSQIVKAAQKLGYVVTFFPDNLVASLPYTSELQAMGVEVVYGKLHPREFYKSHAGIFDAVLLSRPLTSLWHLDYCRAYLPQAKVIYDTVDLHYLRVSRQAEVEKSQALKNTAKDWQKIEQYLIQNTDRTLVVSDVEQRLLIKEFPNKDIDILSNINSNPELGLDLGFDDRSGLLFIGSYGHLPNRDAVTWFTQDIFKRIQKKLPDTGLTLLGNAPTDEIQRLAGAGVDVPGYLQDVTPYFSQAKIFVCPLRYGAGVKGKLTQALSYGLPIVSTSIGVEGMHLTHEVDCLVADTPADFAKQVIRLSTDKVLWEKLHKNSLKVYREFFSEEAGIKALKHALS